VALRVERIEVDVAWWIMWRNERLSEMSSGPFGPFGRTKVCDQTLARQDMRRDFVAASPSAPVGMGG
jgi:hypothetical protein